MHCATGGATTEDARARSSRRVVPCGWARERSGYGRANAGVWCVGWRSGERARARFRRQLSIAVSVRPNRSNFLRVGLMRCVVCVRVTERERELLLLGVLGDNLLDSPSRFPGERERERRRRTRPRAPPHLVAQHSRKRTRRDTTHTRTPPPCALAASIARPLGDPLPRPIPRAYRERKAF